ncbi:hypothetical protein LRS06_05680 [Hymenobacter sp. J193]|uniref:hypothetical protein n=1 Tax=Hymenobacter sp. J193 TaxID=2898429 RepID=UPI0021519798|nr:hypothetical protein [Hymenobacter sp. J193]MCR5887277.1 hypothetical protein [Hymenobacter sp. J193]
MRKPLLVLLLLLLATPTVLWAQDDEEFGFGFYVQGGTNYTPGFKLDSYDRFRASFNQAARSRLQTELGAWQPQRFQNFGGGLYFGPIHLSFNKQFSSATAVAKFKNGDQREMTLDYNPLDMHFELLFGKRLQAGAGCGLRVENATVRSGLRYAGGPLSYGEDQALNGIFRSISGGAITGSARVDFQLVRVKKRPLLTLSMRGTYAGVTRKFLEGNAYLLPYSDQMMKKMRGGSGHADGTLRFYLPEEVSQRNNVYTTMVGGGEAFSGTVHGWAFSANLILTPYEWYADAN